MKYAVYALGLVVAGMIVGCVGGGQKTPEVAGGDRQPNQVPFYKEPLSNCEARAVQAGTEAIRSKYSGIQGCFERDRSKSFPLTECTEDAAYGRAQYCIPLMCGPGNTWHNAYVTFDSKSCNKVIKVNFEPTTEY